MEMESSPTPTRTSRTPTCTAVPGLLVGLTRLFSLTKVCAAPTATPADDETAAAAAAAKPGSLTGTGHDPDPRLVLVRLFDAASALRSGYVRLQRAHFPYDPARIAAADEAMASELDSVAALHSLCSSGRGVGPLVNDRWSLVQRLEAEARGRDSDIAALRRELHGLRRENARLSRQVWGRTSRGSGSGSGRALSAAPRELATTASVLVDQFMAASRSVGDFAELLLGTSSLTAAVAATAASSSSEPCVIVSDAYAATATATAAAAVVQGARSRTWRRCALEAHVWRAMLVGGVEEYCDDVDNFRRIMKLRDPLDALMQLPRSSLSRFCLATYPAAVPAEAEAKAAACGGNSLDQRAFVSRGGHPRTWLYRAFTTAARAAWALRVLMAVAARRSEQGVPGRMRMFYAGRGSPYVAELMESVAAPVGVGVEGKLAVAFTVTPGVKVGDTVVPCRVLLCRRREGFDRIR